MDKKTLRLLILEDNPDDAELEVKELEREGFILNWKRVDTEPDFRKALSENPDLILADFKLPSFSGMAALNIQQENFPYIPLIIVSGTIGEDAAVECMKCGATDYVLKDRMPRLGSVVKRALKEAESCRKQKQAEDALRESKEVFRTIVETAPSFLTITDEKGDNIYVSPNCEEITGYTQEELQDKMIWLVHEDDTPKAKKLFDKTFKKGIGYRNYEYKLLTKKGKLKYASSSWEPLRDKNGKFNGIVFQTINITKRKQAEEKLRASEKRFHILFESAKDGFFLINKKGEYVDVNPAGCRMFGYTRREFLQSDIRLILFPEDIDKVFKNNKKDVKNGGGIFPEYRMRKKDGSEIWVEINVTSFNVGGQELLLGVKRDITGRKQTESAMRESEEKYRAVLEQSAYNIYLMDIESKCILEINAALQDLLGYSTEEMKNLTIYDFIAHSKDDIDNKIKILLKQKQMLCGERKYRRKDGSLVDVEVRGNIITFGGRKALCVVSCDITKRKQAEAALRKSEIKYRLLADNTIDCIWQADADLIFTYVNPSIFPMLGFTPQEWIGSALADHCSKEEMQKVMAIIDKELDKKKNYSAVFEMYLNHKNGRKAPVEIIGKILIDKDNNPKGFQGTTRDISERKKGREELQIKLAELETYYKATIGRESRIIELKQYINALLERLGEKKKYNV